MKRRGRPRLDEESAATERLRVRVTPAQRLDLQRVVDETGAKGGISGVIREAVNEYVSDYRERRVFRRTKETP